MTYAHFTNSKEVIVSTNISLSPADLADFMVSSIIQNNVLLFEEMQEKNNSSQPPPQHQSYDAISQTPSGDEEVALPIDISPLGATITALEVAKNTVVLLEKQASMLRNRKMKQEYQESKQLMTK